MPFAGSVIDFPIAMAMLRKNWSFLAMKLRISVEPLAVDGRAGELRRDLAHEQGRARDIALVHLVAHRRPARDDASSVECRRMASQAPPTARAHGTSAIQRSG